MAKYLLDNYKDYPVEGVSPEDFADVITHWNSFCFNFPNAWVQNTFRYDTNHFINKWYKAYNDSNPSGAVNVFFTRLSGDNQDLLINRVVKTLNKDSTLAEGGMVVVKGIDKDGGEFYREFDSYEDALEEISLPHFNHLDRDSIRYYDENNQMIFAEGGKTHTMPDGSTMLNSDHYDKGGNVYANTGEVVVQYTRKHKKGSDLPPTIELFSFSSAQDLIEKYKNSSKFEVIGDLNKSPMVLVEHKLVKNKDGHKIVFTKRELFEDGGGVGSVLVYEYKSQNDYEQNKTIKEMTFDDFQEADTFARQESNKNKRMFVVYNIPTSQYFYYGIGKTILEKGGKMADGGMIETPYGKSEYDRIKHFTVSGTGTYEEGGDDTFLVEIYPADYQSLSIENIYDSYQLEEELQNIILNEDISEVSDFHTLEDLKFEVYMGGGEFFDVEDLIILEDEDESVNMSDIDYEGGGRISDLKKDLNEHKDVNVIFKLIPNDGSEEDGDENDLDINYVGETYTGGLDSDEPFVELGFQVSKANAGGGDISDLEKDLKEYKDVNVIFKLIPNDGSEEDGDENDLDINYVGETYTGGLDSDEPFVELGFQEPKSYEGGGAIDNSDYNTVIISLLKETGEEFKEIDDNQSGNVLDITMESDAEYRVYLNEDDAYDDAVERVTQDAEENLEYFNRDFVMQYLDKDADNFFREVYDEMNVSHANDIKLEGDDKYDNRLIEEMVMYGLMSKSDAESGEASEIAEDRIDDFVETLTSDQMEGGDGTDYYIDAFGEDELFKLLQSNNLIDIDSLSRDAVATDGIGHFIAGYDGEMIYLDNGEVAFRTN